MNMQNKWNKLTNQERMDAMLLGIYTVSIVLAQLTRTTLGPAVVYLSDLVLIVWLVTHVRQTVTFIHKIKRWLVSHPLSWFVLLWMLIALVVGVGITKQIRPVFISLRLIGYLLFAGSVSQTFTLKPVVVRLALVGIGIGIAWLGVLQYIFLPDTRFLIALGWDDHYYRLLSTLLDPNFTGMILVLSSLAVISLAGRIPKWLVISLTTFLAGCLALTYSRSSFVSWIFAGLLLFFIPSALPHWGWRDKLVMAGLASLTLISVLILAPKPGGDGVNVLRTASAQARIESTSFYLQQHSTWSLLFGNGPFVQPQAASAGQSASSMEEVSVFFTADSTNTIPNHAQAPDNLLITIISGVGIIGAIGVIALLLICAHDIATRDSIAAIAFGATLIHAQFNNTFFEPFIFQYVLLFTLAPLQMISAPERSFRSKKRKNS